MNGINFKGLNFQIEKVSVSGLPNIETSYDMYCILAGLNTAFSENLDTCASFYEQYKDTIFNGQILRPENFYVLSESLQALDKKLGQFLTQEKIVEKPVEKIVEVEVATIQDSLKKFWKFGTAWIFAH